jgi:hypothetical protein
LSRSCDGNPKEGAVNGTYSISGYVVIAAIIVVMIAAKF